MHDPSVTVLIINTNVRHSLVEGAYAQRRAQCESAARALGIPALRDATMKSLLAAKNQLDPVVFLRARHVITENERTLQAADAIQASDWAAFGALMYDSHASLRDDYEVSCKELDAVVNIAKKLGPANGVYGCRMTGAGFGGCVISLVKTELLKSLTRKFDEQYEIQTGTQAAIFSARPGGGARLLS
jgi:galactokinase